MNRLIFSRSCLGMRSVENEREQRSLNVSRPLEQPSWPWMPRADLPHRATLSRFLASGDSPCLETFRTLFEQNSFAQTWTADSIGGIWDRQGRRSIVFDVDATRQASRQRALPCDPTLPSPRRRLDAVCVPGFDFTKTGGGGPHTHRRAANAHSPMDRHVCRSREWRLSRGTRFGAASHHQLLETLYSHRTGCSGSS